MKREIKTRPLLVVGAAAIILGALVLLSVRQGKEVQRLFELEPQDLYFEIQKLPDSHWIGQGEALHRELVRLQSEQQRLTKEDQRLLEEANQNLPSELKQELLQRRGEIVQKRHFNTDRIYLALGLLDQAQQLSPQKKLLRFLESLDQASQPPFSQYIYDFAVTRAERTDILHQVCQKHLFESEVLSTTSAQFCLRQFEAISSEEFEELFDLDGFAKPEITELRLRKRIKECKAIPFKDLEVWMSRHSAPPGPRIDQLFRPGTRLSGRLKTRIQRLFPEPVSASTQASWERFLSAERAEACLLDLAN